MATNYTNTLAGLLVLNDQNLADIYPNQVLDNAPVIAQATAVPASNGTQHKFVKQTYAATAGFRLINTGVTNTASRFEDVTLNCAFLDPSFTRDVALASGYVSKLGIGPYIQHETGKAIRAGMYGIEYSIFTGGTGGQFIGLPQMVEYGDTDYGTQVVDAGGAGGKSVWIVRWAEDGLAVVAGNDGRIDMTWDDNSPTIVQVTDAGGTNVYSAYRVTLGMWVTLQVGSLYDVVRIANLDGTSDDLLTDDVISDALSLFPAGHNPNMIVMNRVARKELQQSRTATNPTGSPAPFPTEAFGVPIVTTDALGSAEATVNATTTTTTTSSSV